MRRLVSSSSTLLFVLALVTVLSLACASTGPTGEPAAAPAPAADAAPAKPAKKAQQEPSFEARKFVSAEHGFSLHYPADMVEETPQGLFTAASPNQVPRVDVNLIPAGAGASLEEVAGSLEVGLAQIGGGDAKVTASKDVTLQDGVTPAQEFLADWSFQGFPLSSIILAVPRGDQSISVQVTTFEGGLDDLLREIAYTLYFED